MDKTFQSYTLKTDNHLKLGLERDIENSPVPERKESDESPDKLLKELESPKMEIEILNSDIPKTDSDIPKKDDFSLKKTFKDKFGDTVDPVRLNPAYFDISVDGELIVARDEDADW